MKRIVRLTESDLVKLVKRVIKEQQSSEYANVPVIDRSVPGSAFKGPYMSQMEGEALKKQMPNLLRLVYILDEISKTGQGSVVQGNVRQNHRVAYQVLSPFEIEMNGKMVQMPANSFLNTCDSRTTKCDDKILGTANVKMGSGDARIQRVTLQM
jgi:hypothetical protein